MNWLRVVRNSQRLSALACVALSFFLAPLVGYGQGALYDLVLLNGRVIDPESRLDAIRNVAVSDGRIVRISEETLDGEIELDVSGLVVAPGFIDLHAHGQTERDARLQAQDGVTTALDVEAGVFPVSGWYFSRTNRAPINFGATASHASARTKVKHDIDVGHGPTSASLSDLQTTLRGWADDPASPDEIERILRLLDDALDDGAIGIGVTPEYTPGASREEIFRIFELAAQRGATVFVHARSSGMAEPAGGIAGVQEVLANAAATGASLHLVHITSTGLRSTPVILEMLAEAGANGVDVSTEVYPYTAGSTQLASSYFDAGWQERLGISYGALQWSATGERLTEESFLRYRQEAGWVVIHMIPEDIVGLALANPLVMVASDGIPYQTGGEHPRGAGTFSRVVGHYARDEGLVTLMDALGKITIMPAQRLESFVPQMLRKGRLQEGMDADITVFDSDTVSDRATFEDPMQPSSGIVHVLVGGDFIVRDTEYLEGAFPGQAIRNSN